MSLELFVRGLYTRTAVARRPCFSWAFLFVFVVAMSGESLHYPH